MRREILLLIVVILLVSNISSEIIIDPLQKVYNLEDSFPVKLKIKTTNDVYDFFQVYLLCNSKESEFYKEYLILASGEERIISPSLKLTKEMIESQGICKIKAAFNGDYILTDEFKVSDLIKINLTYDKIEFAPEERILIYGEAIKENGNPANGFVEIKIQRQNSSPMEIQETVNNGLFFLNFTMPKETKSGPYSITLKIYEKDSSAKITNSGTQTHIFVITQVPSFLEISFENKTIEPGTDLKVKAILKDQAGDIISSRAVITIKNPEGKILKQEETQTDEYLQYFIDYDEPAKDWSIFAVSNQISKEEIFSIQEKEDVKIELINNTIILTNIGNIPYNKTVLIKINNETITGNQILSGKTIEVKEQNLMEAVGFMRNPLIWIFIIAVLGFGGFIFLKRSNKDNFGREVESIKTKSSGDNISRMDFKPRQTSSEQPVQNQRIKTVIEPEKEQIQPRKINPQDMMSQGLIIDSKIREAVLSSSISGAKQESSIICLKIKNADEINGGIKETIQKIISLSEERKAVLYNNKEYLFFILSPSITRNLRNERTALDISKIIKETLEDHNKRFREKINYGISLNIGDIVAAKEKDTLKFMGLGNLIVLAKKIASLSDGEILLSESINYRLMSDVKTEKRIQDGVTFYIIRQIKQSSEENKKFISNFVKRFRENKY
jgi:hypothetical protein